MATLIQKQVLAAVVLISGCGCPRVTVQPQPPQEGASVSLYAVPTRDKDGTVALAVRIYNHPGSKRPIWVNSFMGQWAALYRNIVVDVFDEQGNRVSMFCPDHFESHLVPSKYVALKAGESIDAVVKPWCPTLNTSQVLLFQARCNDSLANPPPPPNGAVLTRGPLVAPLVKYDPAKLPDSPDWSIMLDN